jgi:hypothetical protein
MADMQTALRTRLKNDATVSGLVGTRIDWGARPQGTALPAVTLHMVSDPRPQHMAGFQATRQSWVQVDCWGAKYTDAASVSAAVIAAIVPAADQDGTRFLRSFVDNVREAVYDTPGGQVFSMSVDLHVMHTIP